MSQRGDPGLHSSLPRPWEQAATFEDLFSEQLRKAPWVLLSLAVHAVLLGVLAVFPWGIFAAERAAEIVARVEAPITDPFQRAPEEEPPEVQIPPVVEELIPQDATLPEENPVLIPDEDPRRDATTPPLDGRDFHNLLGLGGGGFLGGPLGGRGGGSRPGAATSRALVLALRWLRDHQDSGGGWSAADFSKNCKTNLCDGAGVALHDVGVTGLALLAFLGEGNTPRMGKYRDTVVKGLQWLLRQQDPDTGLFGTKSDNAYLYRHAIATLAVAESYYFTRTPTLRRPLERAVALIHQSRNPYLAWRYHHPPDGDNDTSVTGWMIFALKAAEDAGIPIDRGAYDGARAWFDRVTDGSGRVGYTERGQTSPRRPGDELRFPADETESLASVALLCRIFLGDDPSKEPVLRACADRIRAKPPRWEVTPSRSLVDEYYWYYGTYAMWQMEGQYWKAWEKALEKALLPSQRTDGDETGSWDPVGAWGRDGGRVYMTAISALCLQVYYRYGKLLGGR